MTAFRDETPMFTPEEMSLIRENLKTGNRLAEECAKRRGLKPHPRIQEWLNSRSNKTE
jgi:hypothetical protein